MVMVRSFLAALARIMGANAIGATSRASRHGARWHVAGWSQINDRRSVQHLPKRIEPRAVAGTIPGLLGRVPMHHAAQVRANRRSRMNLALGIAINRQVFDAASDHRAADGGKRFKP